MLAAVQFISQVYLSYQGWLTPQDKGIFPLPWGENTFLPGRNGRKWGDIGRNSFLQHMHTSKVTKKQLLSNHLFSIIMYVVKPS